jgi:uncharacterized protein (DUF433 family)
MEWRKIITIDPRLCGGKPCIRSLPITVEEVLQWLAEGQTVNDVLAMHSQLRQDDIVACLQFASEHGGAAA